MPQPHRRSLLAPSTAVLVVLGLATVVPAGAAPASGPSAVVSAGPGDVWTQVSERPRARRDGLRQRVAPSDYAGYHLDLDALGNRLDAAPLEGTNAKPLRVEVPAPNGELVEFAVVESPVMEPGLATKHPDITTYAGRSTTGPPASIRLDVTPMGFHASVRGVGAPWYVDPAYNGANQGADALYLSYLGSDLPKPQQALIEPEIPEAERAAERARRAGREGIGEGGGVVAIQRTYRLALVSDPSYAAYFATTDDAVVTAEKTTLMNRVNQLYGDDLSIRMLLVANNDAVNFNTATEFTGANGPCGQQACYVDPDDIGCGDVIVKNRLVVGQIIGADAFDIGHIIFGPDGSGGGVAFLGSVGTSNKAGGCTGLNVPTGDGFAIDYVAHEMGHQFDGEHTFNGTTGSCTGGNRNADTSVEPGSGTSIMAYAGICGVDNLQPHSDPYFSQRSQSEIAAFTRAAPVNDNEIQNIALSGFGAGDSLAITYPGGTTQNLAFADYNTGDIKAAVEASEPGSATANVTGFWGTGSLTNGFQITWSGSTDVGRPVVAVDAGTFTSIVGVTDNGGPEDNVGFDNPAPSGNRNPTVTAPATKTIPIRTPFELTGSATDLDGDSLVYLWEQDDVGSVIGTGLNNNVKLNGPLFRVFGTYANVTPAGTATYNSPGENLATSSPTRSFPDLAQVVAGSTNQTTGSCPAFGESGAMPPGATLDCYSEFLPTTARTLHFRLTARDLGGANAGSDGGTSFDDVEIGVSGVAPFAVTSQATAEGVTGLDTGSVTWDVSGTDQAPISTDNVKVSFSSDGGLTYPTVLLASTPNDGAADVTWPNVDTTQGRIKVEAVDNYFYDLNDADITVGSSSGETLMTGGNAAGATFTGPHSDALSSTPQITATASGVDGDQITAVAAGLPAGLTLARVAGQTSADAVRPGTTRFDVTGTANDAVGTYPVTVTVSDGPGNAGNQLVSFTVSVTKDAATLTYTGDTANTGDTVTVSATVVDADLTPDSVTGTVAFTDQTSGQALCTGIVVSGVASCTFNVNETAIYQVVGTLGSINYTGASTPVPVVLTDDGVGGGDTTPPETTITSGPGNGSFQLARDVVFRFGSEAGATFRCFLKSSAVACNSGSITLRNLAGGTYDFRVVATDTSGNADPTSAARRFYVPFDDRALAVARASWVRRTSPGHFRGTYLLAKKKGATLTRRITGATSLALVLSSGRKFGAVDVFLGNRRLARIAGNGPRRTQRVVGIANFSAPTSGTVRIVTRNKRRVEIDGLAIRTK